MSVNHMVKDFKSYLQGYSKNDHLPTREGDSDKKIKSAIINAILDCINVIEGKEYGFESNKIAHIMFKEIYVNAGNANDIEKKLGFILGFFDILVKEFFVSLGPFDQDITKAEEIISDCRRKEIVKNSRAFQVYNGVIGEYHQRYRIAIVKESLDEKFNSDIEKIFSEKLNDIESKSIEIKRKLDSSSKDLEDLQTSIASSVVLRDFASFSEKVDSKLISLSSAGKRLKFAMCVAPIGSMFMGATLNPPWQFYSSLAVLMLVLGVMLKNNLRSVDQFEQISSKIDNKIAMAKFHRNQIDTLSDQEKEAANAEFMRMIYSSIETKEWSSTDLSEHIISAIRRIK